MNDYIIKIRIPYPNWVGDHYEQTNSAFSTTLPSRGFYFWFGSHFQMDEDAMYFMGGEL